MKLSRIVPAIYRVAVLWSAYEHGGSRGVRVIGGARSINYSQPYERQRGTAMRVPDPTRVRHRRAVITSRTFIRDSDVFVSRKLSVINWVTIALAREVRWKRRKRELSDPCTSPFRRRNCRNLSPQKGTATLRKVPLITPYRRGPANILITAQYINYRACNIAGARRKILRSGSRHAVQRSSAPFDRLSFIFYFITL